ncbi:unnamed protein product [Didymodactylos carnosus]|uniref:Fork-head domain-containing protein n=1 Tax=Didymodactylos carnosus TaxID=1234261 RepID=A0A813U349_9BILA|nr:unnamed protein product [Didymodactylos carnosus]CAF0933723.1 unnamed protein product [Didymodactylos carnosus]CAF3609194.1 unnamed protein product [Didymodactylos carnosus]CAF3709774.1 unnamed protein product [Didymodactylos carnosus]
MTCQARTMDFNLRLDRLECALRSKQFHQRMKQYRNGVRTTKSPLRALIGTRINAKTKVSKWNNSLEIHNYSRLSDIRPPLTYKQLVKQAILESQNKQLTVQQIYEWIQEKFTFYERTKQKWRNAVRNTLTVDDCFKRIKRGLWTLNETQHSQDERPTRMTQLSSSNDEAPLPLSGRLSTKENDYLREELTTILSLKVEDNASSNDQFPRSLSKDYGSELSKHDYDDINEQMNDFCIETLTTTSDHNQDKPFDELSSYPTLIIDSACTCILNEMMDLSNDMKDSDSISSTMESSKSITIMNNRNTDEIGSSIDLNNVNFDQLKSMYLECVEKLKQNETVIGNTSVRIKQERQPKEVEITTTRPNFIPPERKKKNK